MTSADPGEPIVGAESAESAPTPPPAPARRSPKSEGRDENAVVGWARAILGGLSDTAKEVLDEGRRGAAEAYDEGWRRFDGKTRFRRRQP